MVRHYDEDIWNISLKAIKEWVEVKHDNLPRNIVDDNAIKQFLDELTVEKENKPQEGQFASSFLLSLAKHLYLEQEVNGCDYSEVYSALHNVWTYAGNWRVFQAKKEIIWKLLECGMRCPNSWGDFIKHDTEIQRMIVAANYLEKVFGKIPVKYGEFEHTDLDKKVFDKLNNNVRSIGGLVFLEYVINKYFYPNCSYVPDFDRYMLMRQNEKNGDFPWQLLLNLAGKHLGDNPATNKYQYEFVVKPLMEETIKLAKKYLDICGFFAKSSMEYAMMPREEYTYYIVDEQIYEKMCFPMQYSCRYVLGSLKAMIAPYWNRMNKKFTFIDYCKLVEGSYRLRGGRFNVKQISKESSLPVYKTKYILADVAKSFMDINKKFVDFVSEANFLVTPFICLHNRTYLFVDAHFTGISYYLIMQECLNKLGIKDLFLEQGHNLEKWLQDEMQQCGISYKTGSYPAKGGRQEGECDIVLENNGLYFLELKKQSIMREFNNVDDVSLWSVLGRGMLHAQAQAFNHELYWLANKGIMLNNGDFIAYDDNKPVYKFSICFSEYAFLSSKAFTRMLMTVMFTGEVNTYDANRQKELAKLHKDAEMLNHNVQEQNLLLGRTVADLNELISPVVFCSLQQILTAMWCMNSKTGFYEVLREWICRADANLDLYLLVLIKLAQKENPEINRVYSSMVEMAFKHKTPLTVIS